MAGEATMKRLVLFFDGTWNRETEKDQVTNVFRLRRLVEAANIDGTSDDGVPQRIFYDRGVGTNGPVDRFFGGVLGFGLGDNVRQGYRFLSQFYDPGHVDKATPERSRAPDEIYVFGFSRGAFTARSLAGFVAAAGLLRKECCDDENLARAWRYYRTPVKERMPAKKAELEQLCSPDVRIRLVGVFDTVGSLGIPTGVAGNWGGSYDHFHDTKLGSSIDVALQALALDEHRSPFVPALFARPDHSGNKMVEQVWFPGVHSDIGGGYGEGKSGRTAISDISLNWMVQRIRASGCKLRMADPPVPTSVPDDPHDSLGWFLFDRRKPMYRLIKGTGMTDPPPGRHESYSLTFPDVSWHEGVHRSVFDLIVASRSGNRKAYLPRQLSAVAADLRSKKLDLVGSDGMPMTDDSTINALLDAANAAVRRTLY